MRIQVFQVLVPGFHPTDIVKNQKGYSVNLVSIQLKGDGYPLTRKKFTSEDLGSLHSCILQQFPDALINSKHHFRENPKLNFGDSEICKILQEQSGKCFICQDVLIDADTVLDSRQGNEKRLLCYRCKEVVRNSRRNPAILTSALSYICPEEQKFENKTELIDMEKKVKDRERILKSLQRPKESDTFKSNWPYEMPGAMTQAQKKYLRKLKIQLQLEGIESFDWLDGVLSEKQETSQEEASVLIDRIRKALGIPDPPTRFVGPKRK